MAPKRLAVVVAAADCAVPNILEAAVPNILFVSAGFTLAKILAVVVVEPKTDVVVVVIVTAALAKIDGFVLATLKRLLVVVPIA